VARDFYQCADGIDQCADGIAVRDLRVDVDVDLKHRVRVHQQLVDKRSAELAALRRARQRRGLGVQWPARMDDHQLALRLKLACSHAAANRALSVRS
jgi:hypothetical protein